MQDGKVVKCGCNAIMLQCTNVLKDGGGVGGSYTHLLPSTEAEFHLNISTSTRRPAGRETTAMGLQRRSIDTQGWPEPTCPCESLAGVSALRFPLRSEDPTPEPRGRRSPPNSWWLCHWRGVSLRETGACWDPGALLQGQCTGFFVQTKGSEQLRIMGRDWIMWFRGVFHFMCSAPHCSSYAVVRVSPHSQPA